MAASDFISTVQGMYVAYYGRFADQAGTTYWSQQLDASKGDLTQIINSFGSSTEATGIYGSLTNDAKIEKLYQNLFGHAADTAGKDYYAGLLTAGTATASDIAKRILDGAAGDDKLALGSKIAAANNLTNTVDPLFYAGDAAAAAARTLIAGVTSPTTAAAATAAAFSAAVEAIVHPTTAPTPAPTTAPVDNGSTDGTNVQPTTNTLTTGNDIVPGTSADNTFLATQDTLTAFDIINGGAGADKLSIAVSGTTTHLVSGFKTTGVELVEIKSLNAGSVTLDMADVNMVDSNTATAGQTLNTQTPVVVASRESADTTLVTIKNIQDIGSTNIRVEDTAVAHNFSYDAQANQDNGTEAEVQLIENRATDLSFYKESVSGAANSDITSMKLTSTRDIENATNDVKNLSVNDTATSKFTTLTVVHDAGTVATPTAATNISSQTMGDASLRFQTAMDASLVTVDASAHNIDEATAPMFTKMLTAADVGFAAANVTDVKATTLNYATVDAVLATTKVEANSALNCYVETPVAAKAEVAAPEFALVMDMSAVTQADIDAATAGVQMTAVNFKGSQDSTNITFGTAANTKTITTFAGNDGIIANAGANTIDSGAGNDTIQSGTGADKITTGAGNDVVVDMGGNNTIAMGDGNDTLVLLDTTSQDVDASGAVGVFTATTTTAAGTTLVGTDVTATTSTTTVTKTVTTTVDSNVNRGNNNIDMGAGDDSITMQAKELSVGDSITGGAGTDTLVLTNTGTTVATQNLNSNTSTPVRNDNADAASLASWGNVGATELQRTTSIEKYDLRDSNITLTLGDLNFSTADANSVTVVTTKATGVQTVDLTGVTAPTYQVTLDGGNQKDVVIVNDSFFNGMSTLNFAGAVDQGNNTVVDTMRVVTTNGANIREEDLSKITGLERIEFAACCGTAQNWNVELTDAFLNTITDMRVSNCGTTLAPATSEPSTDLTLTQGVQGEFVIYVDPNVPAGSKLTIDASKLSKATSWVAADVNNSTGTSDDTTNDIKVTVIGNNNVSINVINDVNARVNVVATSTDFTANGDNLVGTAGNDTFTATSLNQLNQSDIANGAAGTDTLNLGFGIYQGSTGATSELANQLENINLTSIETLTFVDTTDAANSGVQFQYTTDRDSDVVTGKTNSLMTFNLSGHNDTMTIIANGTNNSVSRADADGRTINGRDGNDTVNVNSVGDVTVNGGTGTDLVTGDLAANVITTIDVETVNTNVGTDNLVIGGANKSDVAVNLGTDTDVIGLASGATGTITVNGGDAAVNQVQDTLVGSAGIDTVVTTDVECIKTGDGNDSITVNNATWNSVTKIVAGVGDDTIALHKDAVASIVGTDIVVYGHETTTGGAGNANHSNSLNGASLAVTSGVDKVTGFHAGAYNAAVNDYIDLTGLLGDSLAASGAGAVVDVKNMNVSSTAVDLTGGSLANVAIVWGVAANAQITTATSGNYFYSNNEVAGAIAKIQDNGEAVIAYSTDPEGDNVASVELIYVTDTDAGTSQHWEVASLGTVTFDRPTGLNGTSSNTGTFNDNFIVGALANPTATTAVLNNFTNDGTTTAVLNYEMCLGAANPVAAYANNTSADVLGTGSTTPTTAPTTAPTGAPTTAPTGAEQTISGAGTKSATSSADIFKMAAATSSYEATINGGFNYLTDKIYVPTGSNNPSAVAGGVNNTTDGNVDLTWSSGGNLVTIHLVGVDATTEAALQANAVSSVFGTY